MGRKDTCPPPHCYCPSIAAASSFPSIHYFFIYCKDNKNAHIHTILSPRSLRSPAVFTHCNISKGFLWGAEPRFELGTVFQPSDALTTLLILSYAAPCCATPHPNLSTPHPTNIATTHPKIFLGLLLSCVGAGGGEEWTAKLQTVRCWNLELSIGTE